MVRVRSSQSLPGAGKERLPQCPFHTVPPDTLRNRKMSLNCGCTLILVQDPQATDIGKENVGLLITLKILT